MNRRAGRSVWYDRRLRKAEAAGSNPARSTSVIVQENSKVVVYGKCLNLAIFGSDTLNLTWANTEKEGLVKLLISFVVPIY